MKLGHRRIEQVRTLSSVVLIGVFGLLATGCSFGKQNTPTAASKIPLRIWRLDQPADPIRDALNQFAKTYPTTALTYQKNTIDNYELSAISSLASGTGPEIWSIPNDWLGDEQNHTTPIPSSYYKDSTTPDTKVAALYPPGIVEQLVYQPDSTKSTRAVYGIPTNVDVLRLYVNPALFDAATADYKNSLGKNYSDSAFLPKQQLLNHNAATWSELQDQCALINVRKDNTFSRSCIALGTADNTPDSNDILQLLMMQNGVDVVSTDHSRALFGDQKQTDAGRIIRPGEEALKFFSSFSNPNDPNYSWNPSMPQAMDAFGQGKLAMVIGYRSLGDDIHTKYPQLNFTSTPVPQVSTTQDPVNFINFKVETVTKQASNTQAAFSLLSFYTDPTDAASMAAEQHLHTPYLADLQKESDNGDTVAKNILTGRSVFKKNRTQFDAAFRDMIINVTQNHGDPSTSLDVAIQKINNLLNPLIPTDK